MNGNTPKLADNGWIPKTTQSKTKVFSGRKTSAFSRDEKFPSLTDLCIHVLQANIEHIYECGDIPFYVLKPVLERAKAEDLMRIEEYNQYLVTETGELWQKIVQKHFPKGEREEFESYREMYERLVDERERKFNSMMGKFADKYQNLKTSNRQTKLAYVDSVAKPPRGVKRAQEKNGTINSFNKKANRGAPSSASSSSHRDERSSSSTAAKKPKIAPMMAKTMKMARGLKTGFRR